MIIFILIIKNTSNNTYTTIRLDNLYSSDINKTFFTVFQTSGTPSR